MTTKCMTIVGTRPELIRLSEIIKQLDIYCRHIFVYTNQSYDYEMSQVFFDELKIRNPNYKLNVKSNTIGGQIANIIRQCERVILQEKPDVVFILGDTNSALSCIIAKRLKITIYHLEAGNRCFDERVPEEINRRIIDHTADINLCYTEHARRNLLREGLHPQNIFVVGSPLPEVYETHRQNIDSSGILPELRLEKNKYILASIHREENIASKGNLVSLMATMGKLADEYNMPIVLSCHPRTRKALKAMNFQSKNILIHKPFGMLDYIKLQINAFCFLSDSGTAHEDAAILRIPTVIIRESNERPEVYDSGNAIMSGLDMETVINSVNITVSQRNNDFYNPYKYNCNCSKVVTRLILGQYGIVRRRKYLGSA